MAEKCTMDSQRECLGLQKVSMLEKQMDEWRESARATHKELYDRVRALEASEAARDVQYETIISKLDELSGTVSTLRDKPGKLWESIVEKAVWAVVGAGLLALLGQFGL